MLLKLGVSIDRLDQRVRRALGIVDACYAKVGEEAVVTSTFEGTHMPNSLHYANLALDVRLPRSGAPAMQGSLKTALGPDFDVVLEDTHIHVEYDPKDP
jgi:hypothetical protein